MGGREDRSTWWAWKYPERGRHWREFGAHTVSQPTPPPNKAAQQVRCYIKSLAKETFPTRCTWYVNEALVREHDGNDPARNGEQRSMMTESCLATARTTSRKTGADARFCNVSREGGAVVGLKRLVWVLFRLTLSKVNSDDDRTSTG